MRRLVIELFGGLGDVFLSIYHTKNYEILDTLGPEDRATVTLLVHNPHVKELFSWHPKRAQLDLIEYGLVTPPTAETRKAMGLPAPTWDEIGLRPPHPLTYYPSPADAEALAQLRAAGDYIVFNIAGGQADRNLSPAVVEEAARLATDAGYKVVTVGRTYNHLTRIDGPWAGHHEEPRLSPRAGLIDVVDRLSVPGTAQAVAGAAAVFCCHSAICLLAWFMKKPVFVLYPKRDPEQGYFKNGSPWTFGRDYKDTIHRTLGEWRPEDFCNFLMMVYGKQALVSK
jgi:hypothetical protein